MRHRRLTITLDVPDELIERAEAVGLSLEAETVRWVDYLETDIRQREAARHLLDIAQRMDSLPDDEKTSPDEIKAAVKQARAELRKHDTGG
jgi:hypothetical protein